MDIARSPPRFRLRRSHIALRVAALTVSVVAIAALGLGRAGPPGGGAPVRGSVPPSAARCCAKFTPVACWYRVIRVGWRQARERPCSRSRCRPIR
ncbi:hypothetical protein BRN51_21100 [Xanthomonas oryzae pv. oryzae]|nr:hypothetical protein BRN51_21100 [Xanthomonas oryzae pv. oryzae]QEJ69088.1 hypothetical protein BXO1_013555 [Xanthomonas oryzae pv. oryzae]QIE14869.1 hypothetical protein IXO1088_004515 [Xanthomonas oryzae pv. oryzae]RBK61345.1 hypothetical protein BRN49_16670 [Xanthomonas oryzae pv. oryzae]